MLHTHTHTHTVPRRRRRRLLPPIRVCVWPPNAAGDACAREASAPARAADATVTAPSPPRASAVIVGRACAPIFRSGRKTLARAFVVTQSRGSRSFPLPLTLPANPLEKNVRGQKVVNLCAPLRGVSIRTCTLCKAVDRRRPFKILNGARRMRDDFLQRFFFFFFGLESLLRAVGMLRLFRVVPSKGVLDRDGGTHSKRFVWDFVHFSSYGLKTKKSRRFRKCLK